MSDIEDIKIKSFKKVLSNIENDRAEARKLLEDVEVYIEANGGLEIGDQGAESSKHKSVGGVASKYIEALQRSNDQLIKVIGLIQKEKDLEEEDLNLDNIYSLLKKEEESTG